MKRETFKLAEEQFSREFDTVSLERLRALWNISMLEKIISCELSPEEAETFCSTPFEEYSDLMPLDFISDGDNRQFDADLRHMLESCLEYYHTAFERDRVMAESFLENNALPNAILIAGGFHTPGLEKQLVENGYSVIVITPRVISPPDKNHYYSLIQNVLSGVEQWFAGRQQLRQPALLWREEHNLGMQFEILRTYLLELRNMPSVLRHVSRLIVDADLNKAQSLELLDGAELYQFGEDVFINFPRYNLAVQIVPIKEGGVDLYVIQRATKEERIPPSAQRIDLSPAHLAVKALVSTIDSQANPETFALKVFDSVHVYDGDDYISILTNIKRALMHGRWNDRIIRIMILEAAVDYVGLPQPDELTEEAVTNRLTQAEKQLHNIFSHPERRRDFVRFLAGYSRINFEHNNYLTPLFIAATNVIAQEKINSREGIANNPGLLRGNFTVANHQWFGADRIARISAVPAGEIRLEPLRGIHTEDNKKRLRILLIGSREHSGGNSPAKLLRRYLDAMPEGEWDEIVIESRGPSFAKQIHPFDSTGNPKESEIIFPFDENGIYHDVQNNIVYRRIRLDDSAYSPLADNFNPPDEYDVVITSDIGFVTVDEKEEYYDYRSNLQQLLAEQGVLFLGMGVMDYATVFQRQGNEYNQIQSLVPFSHLSNDMRNLASIRNKTHYINPVDRTLIERAYNLRLKYQTPNQPAFDILTYTQFLAEFGEDAITLAAFILDEVPPSEIRVHLPHHADMILGVQNTYDYTREYNRFEAIFPHLLNISATDPKQWIVTDSDSAGKENFSRTLSTPLMPLFDNGRYKFELGQYGLNVVVFVTKTDGEWQSIKAFIISNIHEETGVSSVYRSQMVAVSSVVEAAEKRDFGSVPSFVPHLLELEPTASEKYNKHWDSSWVRPGPKYLRIASVFIGQAASMDKRSISLYSGKIYSNAIADLFTMHPLVRSNIKEGAKIFQAIYYLNPQLAGVIVRSLGQEALPSFRYMLTQILNEQFARLLNYEVPSVSKAPDGLTGIDEYILLRLLEPSTQYNKQYEKDIGELFQYLDTKTLTALFEHLYILVSTDYRQGWAPALIGRIFFQSPLTQEQKNAVLNGLDKPAEIWLRLQEQAVEAPIRSAEEIEQRAGDFMNLHSLFVSLRDEGEVHFDKPSRLLTETIVLYKKIFAISTEQLTEEHRKMIESAVVGYKTFEGKTYNPGLWLLFMNAFNGFIHTDEAAFAMQILFYSNPDFAGIILRSIQKGKHFQMLPVLFNTPSKIQVSLVANELLPVSESTFGRFNEIDQFGVFHLLLFRQMFNKMEDLPQDNVRNVITNLPNEALYNLLVQSYFFYQSNPDMASFDKDFVKFIVSEAGEQRIRALLSAGTEFELKVTTWLDTDIMEKVDFDEHAIAEQLEAHPDFQRYRKQEISFDTIASVLQDIQLLAVQGKNDLPDYASHYESILINLDQSEKMLSKGFLSRGIQAWGRAVDQIDALIESQRIVASHIPTRLMQYIGVRIDKMMIDYIARNGLGRIKSILPYGRNKVVGKLRIIPNTQDGIKLLFDQQLLEEGFSVVKEYPQNIPDFARPRAIIAEKGMGRDEHAAERAADWKIPYLVIPHARKLLSGLLKEGETELWVTIELGGRTVQNVLRRATAEEIAEENNYQLNVRHVQSLSSKKIVVPAPDLSGETVQGLDEITLEDHNRFGHKTARLAFMKKSGLKVKEGFGVSFAFFEQFSQRNGLREKINDILAKEDFESRQEFYLAEIQHLILNATFSEEQIDILREWYYNHLRGVPVIARSSTNAEDLPGYAGAGVYESFPDLRTFEDLLRGIKQVYASVWSERAYNNRVENGITHQDVYPAILVQEMIYARYSGVVNTGNEMNLNAGESTMSINVGHGGAVDGIAAEFVFDRTTGLLVEDETDIPDFLLDSNVADLDAEDFIAIDTLGQNVRALFGGLEQKIEFAEDSEGIWVNQSKNLQAFRNALDTQPASMPAAGKISAEFLNTTIINPYGVYHAVARRISEIAARFRSNIVIVKLTALNPDGTVAPLRQRPIANARDMFELQALNIQKGESVKLVAIGPDASQAVKEINRFIAEQAVVEEPVSVIKETHRIQPRFLNLDDSAENFIVVQVRGVLGLHASPASKLAGLLQKGNFKSVVTMYPLTETEHADGFQEITGAPFNPRQILELLMQAAVQGTRFKVTAEGEDSEKTLAAIKEFFENNLGDAETPDDISLDDAIRVGSGLTYDEKTAIKHAVESLKTAIAEVPAESIQVIVFDSFIGSAGYFTTQGFVPVAIDVADMEIIRHALVRESQSISYISGLTNETLPGFTVEIFNQLMDDTLPPIPVSDTIRSMEIPERYL
ncbi:HPr family phosphocarrier protein [bacterium]|nr:HPr family phosphocarrier protein [bacterium]